jgi:hypothetical protein
MKKLVLMILIIPFQAFSGAFANQQDPLLEIRNLSQSLVGLTDQKKLENVRIFLKSFGENWENVKSCGGPRTFSNDWYKQLRLSDLRRPPRNADEAIALKWAREALLAAAQGDTARHQQLLGQIETLNSKLSSCGLGYSSLTTEVMKVLIKARVEIGKELQKLFLNVGSYNRRIVFNNLIECQRNFSEGVDANLDCYKKLLPSSFDNIDHALGVIKESAILTLLLERNQNPPCFDISELNDSENESYQVGTFMSPLFDRNKETSFNVQQFTCGFSRAK